MLHLKIGHQLGNRGAVSPHRQQLQYDSPVTNDLIKTVRLLFLDLHQQGHQLGVGRAVSLAPYRLQDCADCPRVCHYKNHLL